MSEIKISEEPRELPKNYIPEVLTTFYKAEKIHTRHVEAVDGRTIKSTFVFPEYDRTIEPLGHVSMAQIHEALLEAIYCVIQHAIETGPENFDATVDDYLNSRNLAIYKSEAINFKQMLQPGQSATLEVKLESVELSESGRFRKAKVIFSGFIEGNSTCLLPV